MMKFPIYLKSDNLNYAQACVKMLSHHYGKVIDNNNLKQYIKPESPSANNSDSLCDLGESCGFSCSMQSSSLNDLKNELLPIVINYKHKHIVLFSLTKKYACIADPDLGLKKYDIKSFVNEWSIENRFNVIRILPTSEFYELDQKSAFKSIINYLKPFKKYFFQLILGLLMVSFLQLLLPLLTQAIVDIGINQKDIGFINLILLGQLFFFAARMSISFIRSWILLYIGVRLNFRLLSEFILKIFKLPISYFNMQHVGDILQRINDHKRIENFLNSSIINMIYSNVTLLIFGVVLIHYNIKIFFIFLIGSTIYVCWVIYFMKYRKNIDNNYFAQNALNQTVLYQLVTGMQEIKLQNCEKQKRWEWEGIQANLYAIKLKELSINQYQQNGAMFINEIKNIIVIYFSALEVINGNLTLGMMLAIQYIIAQLNGPVADLVSFMRVSQDARLSLNRLSEVHQIPNEETNLRDKTHLVPEKSDIYLENVFFSYPESSSIILNDINLIIPYGKKTAIVGPSGSGKTTLLKLLLKFYAPTSGKIRINNINLNNISNLTWRDYCGAVLQDGYIFSDTIGRNIAVRDDIMNPTRLREVLRAVNLDSFVDSLPLQLETHIGNRGLTLSEGQKQRILIARLIYKNPEFLFFDEATNSLDANNEREIISNLDKLFQGKTSVIVAHRLSTVLNADQIIVLEDGIITEKGSHEELVQRKGAYFKLIRNQLELGI